MLRTYLEIDGKRVRLGLPAAGLQLGARHSRGGGTGSCCGAGRCAGTADRQPRRLAQAQWCAAQAGEVVAVVEAMKMKPP
ncbi:MAG: hypothetical protein U1E74_03710 [Paenacidovorax caeni]